MEELLIDNNFLVEKIDGKGGWTFVTIPQITKEKKSGFGWVRVRGFIDDFEIKQYKLMPMGEGRMFLPLKAEIRKKIGKNEGDWVRVQLFLDESVFEIPEEFLLCLQDEPKALENFKKFTESEQKFYVEWVYSAKKEETKIERIIKSINRLMMGAKFYDKI